jgi:PAS domain-containing protein
MIIGATHIVRDLTELQRLNHDLERRETLLSSILNAVPDAMILIDQSRIVQSFSARPSTCSATTSRR